MNTRPYDHPPVDWTNEDGQRQCRRCERLLTGWGDSLRHEDEAVRPVALDPADAPAVQAAVEIGEQALAAMWTDRCTDLDRAQVVVEALHRHGLVVTRPGRRRRSPSAA